MIASGFNAIHQIWIGIQNWFSSLRFAGSYFTMWDLIIVPFIIVIVVVILDKLFTFRK